MVTRMCAGWVFAAVAMCMLGPGEVDGQAGRSMDGSRTLIVEGHSGIAIPASRLANLTNTGPTVGLEVGYPLTERIGIGVNGDLDFLGGGRIGSGRTAPDMLVMRYGGGLFAQVFPPTASRWSLLANINIGAAKFDSEDFEVTGGAPEAFEHTYFSTGGGLRAAYAAGSRLSVFTAASVNRAFLDETDTERLVALAPGQFKTFKGAWSFPLTVGLNVRM